MEKTLYISDLDGTLLGSDSLLSPRTISTLNYLIEERGALFTVATARTPATVSPLVAPVRLNLPAIVLNGAALWNNTLHAYDMVALIDASTVAQVIDIYGHYGLRPIVYRRHGNWIEASHVGPLSSMENNFVRDRLNLRYKRFNLNDEHYYDNSERALLLFSMQWYDTLVPVYEEIKATVNCAVAFYHDIFNPDVGILELYAPGVSKAAAVNALASEIGATRTVVFGDNRNDIPMMRAATLGIAVQNAFPDVKENAAQVIGPNTLDSVPQWIASDVAHQEGIGQK